MILPTTNGVDKDVDDLYGDQFTVALARAAATLECAPYWRSGEKAPARLARAQELIRHNRVILQDDRLAIVHGSTKPYDVTGFHCTCPASQKGQSAWCVHAVAVKLARTMAEQGPREGRKEAGTRGEGDTPTPAPSLPAAFPASLPLIAHREEGPVYTTSEGVPYTMDDRLAQAASVARDHVFDALPTPQEDRMPQDEYIPEPDTQDTPVAVLEATDADFPPLGQPRREEGSQGAGEGSKGGRNQGERPDSPPAPPHSLTPFRPSPSPVDDLEAALQVWTTERAVVQRFLKQELKANIDYYTLRIGSKDSKPSLSKAGAEKVMGWLKIQASFSPDTGTWEMLGRPQDLLCYVCTLRTRSGEIVGEGRGARSLKKDGGDVNKAIKMAEKSSMVSAVLRTGALSDVFTQDLEDMQEEEGSKGRGSKEAGKTGDQTSPPRSSPLPPSLPAHQPTSQDLRQRIWQMVKGQAPDMRTREQVETWIKQETGYDLHPDRYRDIIESLTVRA